MRPSANCQFLADLTLQLRRRESRCLLVCFTSWPHTFHVQRQTTTTATQHVDIPGLGDPAASHRPNQHQSIQTHDGKKIHHLVCPCVRHNTILSQHLIEASQSVIASFSAIQDRSGYGGDLLQWPRSCSCISITLPTPTTLLTPDVPFVCSYSADVASHHFPSFPNVPEHASFVIQTRRYPT
jgi:hypothetical protein